MKSYSHFLQGHHFAAFYYTVHTTSHISMFNPSLLNKFHHNLYARSMCTYCNNTHLQLCQICNVLISTTCPCSPKHCASGFSTPCPPAFCTRTVKCCATITQPCPQRQELKAAPLQQAASCSITICMPHFALPLLVLNCTGRYSSEKLGCAQRIRLHCCRAE